MKDKSKIHVTYFSGKKLSSKKTCFPRRKTCFPRRQTYFRRRNFFFLRRETYFLEEKRDDCWRSPITVAVSFCVSKLIQSNPIPNKNYLHEDRQFCYNNISQPITHRSYTHTHIQNPLTQTPHINFKIINICIKKKWCSQY